MTRQRLDVGAAGEEAARAYLKDRGYRIEMLNYRCPLGEIDIVAREGARVVFFEVRSGTRNNLRVAAESITRSKKNRLSKLALYYLQSAYGRELPCRIDFLAVLLDRESLKVRQIQHIQNIAPGDI